METTELYYPQIVAAAGGYSFAQGIEIEIYSAQESYCDWAKLRFTEQYRPKLQLERKAPAAIRLGYNGVLDEVFAGFVSKRYDGGASANEVELKDETLLLEETRVSGAFQNAGPQEIISYCLSQAGISAMKLSSKPYPARRLLPVREQSVVEAINTVNAAWGLKVPFFFSGGTFYWDEKPEQAKQYTFEYGVNIIGLHRTGGVWELETVSAPFVRHSHRINIVHPRISGKQEVRKVVFTTNDSGFIRTYIYF